MENVLKETCFYETILLETNYIQNKANNAKVIFKRLSLCLLFITIPLALLAKVISQHGSQNEIFLSCQLV